jgi:hypothetical protein
MRCGSRPRPVLDIRTRMSRAIIYCIRVPEGRSRTCRDGLMEGWLVRMIVPLCDTNDHRIIIGRFRALEGRRGQVARGYPWRSSILELN